CSKSRDDAPPSVGHGTPGRVTASHSATLRDGCGLPLARRGSRLASPPEAAAGAAGPLPEPVADRRTAGRAPGGRAGYLIRSGAVVTVDPDLGILPRGDVRVRDGQIAEVGTDLSADGDEVIDASRMIVMPGFVETHFHMWS